MDNRFLRPSDFGVIKAKAVDDARQMQARVIEECKKAGKDPPPYGLEELIGKGSFGRVYKGKDMKSAATVAVKIIDIDESDTINPRNADSYSEFLKEIGALKILSESKAKNINHIIEALPVSQAMWMITEYCGGGSVATLMKPTAPGGLQEKWIIPILREVAEALKWVHQAGIIHRDVKCANVLITELGAVQLCDFGVAGIAESKIDKRSTIIGTPHWMAPELFDAAPSYGKEVDIWAFGAMVFEIATGLPPNVTNGISFERLGNHLRQYVPRLEGGNYSTELRRLVAYCLEEDPKARPTIEQVQKHAYIFNTASSYPTASLDALVASFRVWEARGGSRKSLFFQHGAQNPSSQSLSALDDEWNFSTTEVFDKRVAEEFTARDVYAAYGPTVVDFDEETARPNRGAGKSSRRRPPPEALGRLPAQPLEKIFDPNTLSNYNDNSRAQYGPGGQAPQSDLPLRDNSAQTSIRDTMIDLGGHDAETGMSSFNDVDTLRVNRRHDESDDDTLHDFSRPALSDPADTNPNRRTQDWKFPSMAPPASADPELSHFPTTFELPIPRLAVTPGSGARPALVHHPTEPVGAFGGGLMSVAPPAMERLSMQSLIDLDMSNPDPIQELVRPSTANSEVGSTTSEQITTGNPFEFERHSSIYQPASGREPSIYVSDESPLAKTLRQSSTVSSIQDMADMSDFSASDAEGPQSIQRRRYDSMDDDNISLPSVQPGWGGRNSNDQRHRQGQSSYPSEYGTSSSTLINSSDYGDSIDDYMSMPPPAVREPSYRSQPSFTFPAAPPSTFPPPMPEYPSRRALSGDATPEDFKAEFNRVLKEMSNQLTMFRDAYESPARASLPMRGSSLRRDPRDEDGLT